jgi:hypothetical protein
MALTWLNFGKNLGVLKELTVNQQYRKLLGSINVEVLDRIIIKIAGKVNEWSSFQKNG